MTTAPITAKRYSTNEKAHIEVYGHVGTLGADLKNVSKTGACLEISKGNYLPQKGDLLNLTVTLDKLRKTYSIAAEVIWAEGMGLGICFINKDEVLERMMAKAGAI
ncbi:MAG TPA: PilZ domain-containing protein [Bdellovibrio sp.]|nr:PilZ domain-containing protein [Bdellovibrio sp.]